MRRSAIREFWNFGSKYWMATKPLSRMADEFFDIRRRIG